MAAQQPRQCHPTAGPQAEAVERLVGVVGACRQMPAMKAYERGEREPIDFNQTPAGEARAAAGSVE